MRTMTTTVLALGFLALPLVVGACDSDSDQVARDTASSSDSVAASDLSAGSDTVTGSDTGPDVPSPGQLAVVGAWDDQFNGSTEITATHWGTYSLELVDAAARWAVGKLPADDEWNPNTFAKITWTEPEADGRFWTCTVAYGSATLEAARDTTAKANASDPANGGCGDFSWTRMVPQLEVTGSWDDAFGSPTVAVTSLMWGSDEVAYTDGAARFLVLHVAADAEWNPGTFSRMFWTEPAIDASFYVCIAEFALGTLDAALSSTVTADASDPAAGGCGEFGWTKLTAAPTSGD